MSQADISRYHPILVCNKCQTGFQPYGEDGWAPILDEVACPSCGTKRILYYGNETSVVKMILSTYGVNKELEARMTELENKVNALEGKLESSIADARQGMIDALKQASKEAIAEHEKKFFHYSGEKLGNEPK